MSAETTVSISASNVMYDVETAAVEIDDLIEMLEMAREDGATHIVGLSGNYRGAKYVRLETTFEWLDD